MTPDLARLRALADELRHSRASWENGRSVPTPLEAAADDAINALLTDLETARAQVAAMRTALKNLEHFARAYAGSTGLRHEHSLWSALDKAQRTLSPAAGDAP